MNEIKRILVPVDFSTCSTSAFEYALFLGAKFGAQIDLLHAWTAPAYVSPYTAIRINSDPDGPETLEMVARKEAAKQIDELVAAATIPEGVEVGVRIEFGIESDIIRTAADGYDLVVMGTHGRAGLSHFFLGSVAEKVVRDCPVPVVTVRAPAPKEE